MYCYKYPRPALTVDALVFAEEQKKLKVLLIQRKHEPFKSMWASPGGFLEMDETCKEGAMRELKEETGMEGVELEQFYVFDGISRDPRERIITVAHLGVTDIAAHNNIEGADDATSAQWFDVEDLPPLAADHKLMIATAVSILKKRGLV